MEVENSEEIEKEEHGDREANSQESNHGGRKRILIARATRRESVEAYGYIASTIRLRSSSKLGTKQLGSQWDHISTTAPVGRNKMASTIRLLFHPGGDRPFSLLFFASPRLEIHLAPMRCPIGELPQKAPAMPFPASRLQASIRSHPLWLSRDYWSVKKSHIRYSPRPRKNDSLISFDRISSVVNISPSCTIF